MNIIHDLIKSPDTHLIDVRTPAEYNEVSVGGSRNIPLDEVPDRLEEFKAMKGQIVLFCRSGNRSQQAMLWLKQQGLDNVHNGGGYSDVMIHKI